jgi:hypothetical protein
MGFAVSVDIDCTTKFCNSIVNAVTPLTLMFQAVLAVAER